MEDLDGLRGAVSAQLAAGEDATAGWSKRSTASAAATARRSPRSSGISRRRFRSRPSRWRTALRALITFYRTGETRDREAYDIAWVQDKASPVDTINGFIEVYLDARGIKGAWESARLLRQPREDVRDPEASPQHAQWFEDRMPWDREVPQGGRAGRHRQRDRRRRSKPAIRVRSRRSASTCRTIRRSASATAASRCRCRTSTRPTTSRRCRSSAASSRGRRRKPRGRRSGARFAGELTTNMHEVIGHAIGQGRRAAERQPAGRAEGAVLGDRGGARRSGRAVFPARSEARRARPGAGGGDHDEIVRAEYEGYTRNALVQLRRVREGTQIEEDHMRNRQMIVHWLMANTNAIEVRTRDGKTYYVMTDPKAFRDGVGRLLAEVQRIKAEGDYDGGARAVRNLRRAFRSGAARRSGRARRSAAAAVVHRLRDAEARARSTNAVGRDHRRRRSPIRWI